MKDGSSDGIARASFPLVPEAVEATLSNIDVGMLVLLI